MAAVFFGVCCFGFIT